MWELIKSLFRPRSGVDLAITSISTLALFADHIAIQATGMVGLVVIACLMILRGRSPP